MSDLHQAVQARIASHIPQTVPSFEALKHRGRARDRRRYAMAGSVLATVAVGAAALALGWPGAPGDSLMPPTTGGPSQEQPEQAFTVRPRHKSPYFPNAGEGLTGCLALPGVSEAVVLRSEPPQYRVTVTGPSEITGFESCANAVPGYFAERTDQPALQGHQPPQVEVRVDEPATAGKPVRLEAVIQDDRDVAVHRVEFGDGTAQIVRFTCVDASDRVAPADQQVHVVEHTWKAAGEYTVTVHYGPPCGEVTSSVSHGVSVTE